jgi:uncharacterized protein (TIGR02300 family)
MGDRSVTKASLGLKRHCPGCASRFYDLGRNPANCPKCGYAHDINAPVKTRRGRSKIALVEPKAPAPVKEKPKPEKLAKKPVKQIEGVNLDEFEDIAVDTEEEIEEIEEIEDVDAIEDIEIEDTESAKLDDDIALEDEDVGGAVLIDNVEDEDGEEEDEEEEESGKSKSKTKRVVKLSKSSSQAKPKPKVKAKRK